jgi:hypothetical protein
MDLPCPFCHVAFEYVRINSINHLAHSDFAGYVSHDCMEVARHYLSIRPLFRPLLIL